MRRFSILIAAMMAMTSAAARAPDGTLALIETPNNGIPAIVKPGQRFEAVLAGRAATMTLTGPQRISIEATWTALPGGKMRATCSVAASAPVGVYALEATAGDQSDRNLRSVYVRGTFPESYVIGHLSDTHIGSNRHTRTAEAIGMDVVAAVNGSKADFVLVTGDLTENGETDQFRSFLRVLDTCTLPTFVCAGNHDRKGLNYERFFGPDTYMFRYGGDGYISFDTKDRSTTPEWGGQDADLQVFRRAIEHTRWAIGFSHRYEMGQGMRSQLILFVDNPLDHLMFGHWHSAAENVVPWGTTRYTSTPAAVNGSLRYFDVSAEGVKPRRPERVATTR